MQPHAPELEEAVIRRLPDRAGSAAAHSGQVTP